MPDSVSSDAPLHTATAEERGDAANHPLEFPPVADPVESQDPEVLRQYIKQIQADERARFQQWQSEAAQFSAKANADIASARREADPSSAFGPAVVSIDEANAVVHARDRAAEQVIAAKEAEKNQALVIAESERQRLQAESISLLRQLNAQANEARLAVRAAEQKLAMAEAAARAQVEQERAKSHMMQKALQEGQGNAAVVLGSGSSEYQALKLEIMNSLRAEMLTMQNQPPLSSSASALPTVNPSQDANSQLLAAIAQGFQGLGKRTNPSSAVKLSKFESAKAKEEAAALWIERFEIVARDENWFQTESMLGEKLMLFLDDVSWQWVGSLLPVYRMTSNWALLKSKWKQRFGLSREQAMGKLTNRRQGSNEDVRSFGESIRHLCLSADLNCNEFSNCSRLVEGFQSYIRRQLILEKNSAVSGKSFEDILEGAVEIERTLTEHFTHETEQRTLDLPKKAFEKIQDSNAKKGGGNPPVVLPMPAFETPPPVAYPSNQSGGKGHPDKGGSGGYGGGKSHYQNSGNGGYQNNHSGGQAPGNGGYRGNQSGGQAFANPPRNSGGPTGAQGAVPMDIGAVTHQLHGRTNTITAGWHLTDTPEVCQTRPEVPPSVLDHMQVSMPGRPFFEAISSENRLVLAEAFSKPPWQGESARNFTAQGSSLVKDHEAKTVPQPLNRPFQRPAAPTGVHAPPSRPLPFKPSIFRKELASKPDAAAEKGPSSEPMGTVHYTQIGVMEMAKEYSLVQCKAIFKDCSYDCVLDSGSCLNLLHWRTVKEFGLTHSLVNRTIPYRVADGRIAHTMGELPNVILGFGDCSFEITFSVVEEMENPILMGTSFLHQAGCVLSFHNKEPHLQLCDIQGNRSTVPVTYHRSHPWIRKLESDRRNWPADKASQEEGAPTGHVCTTLPHFSKILSDASIATSGCSESSLGSLSGSSNAASAPSNSNSNSNSDSAPGCSSVPNNAGIALVAVASVELEIDQMSAELDGEGPSRGLSPLTLRWSFQLSCPLLKPSRLISKTNQIGKYYLASSDH